MQKQPPTGEVVWQAHLREHYRHLFVRVILPIVLITAGFVLLCLFCPPVPWMWLYLLVCYAGLVFVFFRLGHYLHDELVELLGMQWRIVRMEKEAQGLQRDAAIGHSVRALTHEINNLIGVAALSVDNLRHSSVAMPKDIDRLERALGYMSNVSALVLDGIGNKQAPKRLITLAELRNDVQLLLGNGHSHPGITLHLDFPPNADNCQFEERAGSTYLIIHNLVKNAFEAVAEKFGEQPDGEVIVKAEVSENQLLISVSDNGVGMTPEQVEAVMQGDAQSFKANGHGLGLGFVVRECEKNGFCFAIRINAGRASCLLWIRERSQTIDF
ncbi:MAG: HAMP domain-containing sensor histidine kinase [Thiothrix litoralis]|uniref:ATP-binding protein n=1 Tax=Thiothrix litoralis TaxID=2891210 RepID=UPI003C72B845